MLEKLSQSSGNVLGYKVIGTLTKTCGNKSSGTLTLK